MVNTGTSNTAYNAANSAGEIWSSSDVVDLSGPEYLGTLDSVQDFVDAIDTIDVSTFIETQRGVSNANVNLQAAWINTENGTLTPQKDLGWGNSHFKDPTQEEHETILAGDGFFSGIATTRETEDDFVEIDFDLSKSTWQSKSLLQDLQAQVPASGGGYYEPSAGGGGYYEAPAGGGGYYEASAGGGGYYEASAGGGGYYEASAGGGGYYEASAGGGGYYEASAGGGGYYEASAGGGGYYEASAGGGGYYDTPDSDNISNYELVLGTKLNAYSIFNDQQINETHVNLNEYSNNQYRFEVTDNFLAELENINFDSVGGDHRLSSAYLGLSSNQPEGSIQLLNYRNESDGSYDIDQLNEDLGLEISFVGDLIDNSPDYILNQSASLQFRRDDNGTSASVNIVGDAVYDSASDTTNIPLGFNEGNRYQLRWLQNTNNADSNNFDLQLENAYIGIESLLGNESLSINNSSSLLNDDFSIAFDTSGIPDNPDLTPEDLFSNASLTNTIDFSDHKIYGNLGLLSFQEDLSQQFESHSTRLNYDIYENTTNTNAIGNFWYQISNDYGEDFGGNLNYIYLNDTTDYLNSNSLVADLTNASVWGSQEGGNNINLHFDVMNSFTSNYHDPESGTNQEISLFDAVNGIRNIDTLYLSNIFSDLDTAYYETTIDLEQGAVLGLEYELSAIDASSFYEGMPFKSDALEQLAVLGDSVDWNKKFVLDITAESYLTDYNIESTDITIDFDPNLFGTIGQEHIMIGGALPIGNAVEIDNENGTIRIAAASLSDLNSTIQNTGFGISDATPLVSIALDFDENQVQNLNKNPDGSLTISPLAFDISANQQETVFSRSFIESDTGLTNREIVTLDDLGGEIDVYGTDVTLYEAKINLEEQGDGLVLGTQRIIGADKSFTNLVRANDTLTTSAEWLNVGNIEANNLTFTKLNNDNAELVNARFSQNSVGSGSFENGYFVEDARESTILTADIKIANNAGQVLDLADGIVSVEATGSEIFTNGLYGKGSSNLITYQGDLNYDGRVSMKDLAYLNAGAARQVLVNESDEYGNSKEVASEASYARDVDADFNGKIDLSDLSVLDQDWGRSLHTSDQGFTGSDDVSWNELDNQGQTSWDNDSFKDQNSIEADTSYEGSLESPTTNGVIGADGNENANDGDLGGNSVFQDPLAV